MVDLKQCPICGEENSTYNVIVKYVTEEVVSGTIDKDKKIIYRIKKSNGVTITDIHVVCSECNSNIVWYLSEDDKDELLNKLLLS